MNDLPTLHGFVERYSFATLVTTADGTPFATHLPVLLDRERGRFGTLVGHFARANPHAQMDHGLNTSLVIFHGPHGYISPGWYRTENPHVPTWNYAAVHAYGRLVLITEKPWMRKFLERLVTTYESRLPKPWKYDPSDPQREKLLGAIVGFEMPIERLEGKFKLNQNREPDDRAGAIEGLETLGDSDSIELALFMRAHLSP